MNPKNVSHQQGGWGHSFRFREMWRRRCRRWGIRVAGKIYREIVNVSTGSCVWRELNEYVIEGNVIKKQHVTSCIKQLCNFKRFPIALQVMEWMEMRKINYSYADYTIRLDLISKTKRDSCC
ncbi:hypothetical protein TorRG33x02_251700 [Trema orientale]|uniref:Pentatricopeptide repeat n=1 Tax=Trema orientale TaxID=63057 RepID=A0A2P5DGD0_TREOI|nr:hypothetical protein TorRG33x02_251700 [Trema orientale]